MTKKVTGNEMANILSEQNFDFSGGIQQSVGRLLASKNEVDTIINGELEIIGPISKVRGDTQRGSDVNTNYDILGAMAGYKSDGTMKQIVVADNASNSDAYTYNPITDSWTAHNLSLTTGARAEFEYFLDGFFMVNFSDTTRWNDFTQWYTTTNVTSAPKGKYIKLYLSRIYIAYVSDGGSTFPSRVIYSDLPSGTPYTIAWNNSENYFDVDADDNDVIKGLGVNANRLLIFKENSLHRYDTNSRYKVPGAPGTTSHRSIQNVLGTTLYLHTSGIWLYDGETSKLVSRQIKDIIEGISTKNLANACAWSRGDHYYLYLGDISNSKVSLDISNCLVDYDVAKNAYSVRSITKDPLVFFSYRDDRSNVAYNDATLTYDNADISYNGLISSEERIYYGDTLGGVYQFDSGNSFDGTAIPFIVETKDLYLNYPAIYKLFHKIHIFVNGRKGIQVQYKLDDGNWKTLGKVTKTQTELLFPSGARGKRIKLRFSESGTGDRFILEGYDLYFSAETLED